MTETLPSLLPTRCRELREKIGRLAIAAQNGHILNLWRPVRDGVEFHLQRTNALLLSLGVLQAQGLLINSDFPSNSVFETYFKNLAALQKRLVENRSDLLGKNSWAKYESSAKELTAKLEEILKKRWSEHLSVHLDGERLQFASKLGHHPKLISEINTLQAELQTQQRQLPIDVESFLIADEKKRRLLELWDELDDGNMPLDVREFLKQSTASGARLSDLSDSILKWLRDHDHAQKLLILSESRFNGR